MTWRPEHRWDRLIRLLLWGLVLHGDGQVGEVSLGGLFIMREILVHRSPIVESKILEEVASLVLMVGPPHVMRVEV